MQLLDGKKLAETIKAEIADEVERIRGEGGKIPHLAAVLAGADPASETYVRNKVRSCERVGFRSSLLRFDDDVSSVELLKAIDGLNRDEAVDGFIVQLPLPGQVDEEAVTLAIDPAKDVDGFHPVNVGRMTLGLPAYLPATPNGIMTMFERYEVPTSGRRCVVLGRSNIVGTPMAILLSRNAEPGNCTVTLCHSRTRDPESICRSADILIAALGRPGFVTADFVKEGAAVVDVGITRVPDTTKKRGYRLRGDVDFEAVADRCSFITPVPGGVGPMTVTSLLLNTLRASRREVYAAS